MLLHVMIYYDRRLTIIVIGWNSSFFNHETRRLETVGHDTVTTAEDWGNVQVSNSAVGNDVWRAVGFYRTNDERRGGYHYQSYGGGWKILYHRHVDCHFLLLCC